MFICSWSCTFTFLGLTFLISEDCSQYSIFDLMYRLIGFMLVCVGSDNVHIRRTVRISPTKNDDFMDFSTVLLRYLEFTIFYSKS
ncbi:hypothetical protein BpHYR1_051578 [Brachionus plicatilis]|uniref:Uncharacterized protein n=1 Tax=Brachionus plicatilis TaxID=10195 RepID=A0A3M7PW43_BRAPC|nr:hypothetical protein BpHYR1_051578 [Brachionus plicatilis]